MRKLNQTHEGKRTWKQILKISEENFDWTRHELETSGFAFNFVLMHHLFLKEMPLNTHFCRASHIFSSFPSQRL